MKKITPKEIKEIKDNKQIDLAKIGIIALIDEATKYQETRPDDDLKQTLKKIKQGYRGCGGN